MVVRDNSGKRLGGDHTQGRKDGEAEGSVLKQWSIEGTLKQRLGGAVSTSPGGRNVSGWLQEQLDHGEVGGEQGESRQRSSKGVGGMGGSRLCPKCSDRRSCFHASSVLLQLGLGHTVSRGGPLRGPEVAHGSSNFLTFLFPWSMFSNRGLRYLSHNEINVMGSTTT